MPAIGASTTGTSTRSDPSVSEVGRAGMSLLSAAGVGRPKSGGLVGQRPAWAGGGFEARRWRASDLNQRRSLLLGGLRWHVPGDLALPGDRVERLLRAEAHR